MGYGFGIIYISYGFGMVNYLFSLTPFTLPKVRHSHHKLCIMYVQVLYVAKVFLSLSIIAECTVLQNFHLIPFQYLTFVNVLRLITIRNAFFCTY